VKAYNDHFESPWSNEVNITVDWLPVTPKGLTVKIFPEGNALNISWIPNQLDTKGYYLYVRTTGAWSLLKYNDHPENSYDHGGLIDGQSYYYRLRAVDYNNQYSNYSSVVDAVPADSVGPASPTGLLATPKSYESILLTWEPNTEADLEGYNIYRSTDQSPGNWGIPINQEGIIDEESYEDTGLDDLVKYYYVVTALDEVPNESGYSNTAEATTLLGPHPPEIYNPVDNFEITEDTVDNNTINLYSWFKDLNGDKLTFRVEGDEYIEITISQDNGTVILKPEHNWNGKETLTFYAEDITGEVSDEVRITVIPVNDPPYSVKITEPVEGHEINDGMGLNFQGSFEDADKRYGDLFEFDWTSNISGNIGDSLTLSNVKLPIGIHHITFTVTDQELATASAFVNITVLETTESDSDRDGLPNYWERKYGLNPNDPTDASLDSDSDGVINSVEFDLDIDPTNSDTDNDGLNDGEELNTYFTDPSNADTDGDDHDDGEDKYPLDPYRWKDDQSDSEDDGVMGSDNFWIIAVIIIVVIIVVIILIFLFLVRPRLKKKTEPPSKPTESAIPVPVPVSEVRQPLPVQEPQLTPPPVPVQQPPANRILWDEE
jgi:hypothetical protein